jgi:hypothetical protein
VPAVPEDDEDVLRLREQLEVRDFVGPVAAILVGQLEPRWPPA